MFTKQIGFFFGLLCFCVTKVHDFSVGHGFLRLREKQDLKKLSNFVYAEWLALVSVLKTFLRTK